MKSTDSVYQEMQRNPHLKPSANINLPLRQAPMPPVPKKVSKINVSVFYR